MLYAVGCTMAVMEDTNQLGVKTIYIVGGSKARYYTKEEVYEYLKENPHSIQVDIPPFPYLIPLKSRKGKKYVRSEPSHFPNDNLLNLLKTPKYED